VVLVTLTNTNQTGENTMTTTNTSKFVNCNKHEIIIVHSSGEEVSFPPSGIVATVSVKTVPCPSIAGFTVNKTVRGAVQGLPDPVEGTVYIVNAIVLSALEGSGRTDVVAPDTGASAIRFEDGPQKGQVRAVRQFNCL
jgi:hypothetical protein